MGPHLNEIQQVKWFSHAIVFLIHIQALPTGVINEIDKQTI